MFGYFGRIFFQVTLVDCFFQERMCLWTDKNVFCKYLCGKNLSPMLGSRLPGTRWKTSRLHKNVTTNLWRNDCRLLISFIVLSSLLPHLGSHKNSPLQKGVLKICIKLAAYFRTPFHKSTHVGLVLFYTSWEY